MNRIRLLSEQVANQIAAGEVIERPASVVKELVENALDAEAGRVAVEIQAGGRSLVRVTDEGTGMSRDDALLCLERHATSKIERAEDLAAIATMGFRGEALPSIASVSRFTLTTRERGSESPEGTQIHISGGKIVEVKAAGSPPGTTVEVRQLFFNLPARRKFLRTEETESGHIQHYLTLAALAYPEVAFTFQKDGRTVWQLPAIKTGADMDARLAALRERLRALYGHEQKLLPVAFSAAMSCGFESPEDAAATAPTDFGPRALDFRLWGFIGAPGVSRATREDQHVFVNRRPVENRGLNFALLEGYHTALMKGRYPVCCLFLELPPAAVDVNIHPSKREVKFHQEMEARRLVAQAVRQTLLDFHGGKVEGRGEKGEGRGQEPEDSGPAGDERTLPNFPAALRPAAAGASSGLKGQQPPLGMGFGPAQPKAAALEPVVPAGMAAQVEAASLGRLSPTSELSPVTHRPPGQERPQASAPPALARTDTLAKTTADESAGEGATIAPSPAPPSSFRAPPSGEPVPLLKVPLRLIGVIGRLYVVLESDRGLVLLDQHAAHERVLFEQMLNRLEQHGAAPSQKLLLPETVEVPARDANFLREQLAVLTRLGVGLSEFGERTFLLDALPPFVKVGEARRFVLELVDELKAAGQEVNTLRLGEHTVAKTVCRHAVKANDPLAGLELENLVEDLRHCAMPYTCPHGRPTLIEMNFRELEKKFGRTQ